MSEHVEVAIVGGGQAGLAAGYYLAQQGRNFVILEQAPQIGHSWRTRWDSLKLITPSPYNNLPGLPFPKMPESFPNKDETANYLELYAETFKLPVRLGSQVSSVKQAPNGYLVQTGTTTFETEQVVVATGPYQTPRIPPFSVDLAEEVFQIHSSQYRNSQQLPPGDVLVVGSGNSGPPIARELSTSHKIYLSVGNNPRMPRRVLGQDLFWWLYKLGVMNVTIESRFGKRLSQRPDPLVGINLDALTQENGVVLVGRTQGVQDNKIVFVNKQSIQVSSVIWATGFQPDYRWIEVPVFDERGMPMHKRGVTAAPGFYFLGLRWQYRVNSSLLGGVGRDAAFIASEIATRVQKAPRTSSTDCTSAKSLYV